jgi:hypothetical protein
MFIEPAARPKALIVLPGSRYQADFSARFRHSRSRQDRFAPAPVKYMRLAKDTSGFRRRMDTKLTSSCQFD